MKKRTARGSSEFVTVRISQAAYQAASDRVKKIEEDIRSKTGTPVRVSVSAVVERMILGK